MKIKELLGYFVTWIY